MFKKSSKRLSASARSGVAIVTLMAVVMGLLGFTAEAASATNITPTGLTKLTFAAGSFLTVNTGLSTQQHFDLGPSSGLECTDGVQNNDIAPLGTVGSGGGTDGLFDFYPIGGSRDIVAGTATGGSTTTVVDSTATWTTNQFAGDSVWLTAGPGGNATTPPGAHIASNTATTLTVTAAGTSTPNGTAGFTTAAGAGSVYHVSLADPECVSAADNSETAAGLQPKENVVIVATVNANGTTSIPKTVRTSEADATTNGGIYFPPAYIPDATEGVIQAGIQPAPTAAPGTPFAGTINIDSGAVSMPINIRIQLQGGSGLTALGTGCYVPSSSDSGGIPLNLQTGTTDPPGPNQPITGVPFNTHNGRFTAVDNSFSVAGAGSNCALLNLGASSINTAFGLPAAAGLNTASFTLQTSPALNYNGPADAGPDQFVHDSSLVTLDGSQSFNAAADPIATYSWLQTSGPAVTLTGDSGPNPTFTSDASDAVYTFALTVTTTLGATSTDNVTITNSANVAPVVNAGPDQTGKVAGNVVQLKGTASDANNDPLTITWTQVPTGAPTVTFSDPHALRPTFTVPPVDNPSGDNFQFDLTASDAFGGSATDRVGVTAVASTPTVTVAKARSGGTCSNFCTGDVVTLSAVITNPDGTSPTDYTYTWSQTGGRTTPLSSTTVSNPTYSLPSSGAAPTTAACTSGTTAVSPTNANCPTYTVTVTKTNTAKSSAPAALAAYASTLPTRPVANAGAGQTRGPNRLTTLNGTASTQANGHTISYAWTQTAGSAVTLSSSTVASPTFTTPATPQTLTFSLIVTDTQSPITGNGTNGNTSTAATTNITVSADQVVADAGPDQTGKVAGNTVTLTAAASTDPDGLPLTYSWQQLSGPTVTLSSTTAVSPTFVVPPVDNPTGFTWTFTVTATNGNPGAQNTNTDATPVTITAVPSTPTVAAPTKARSGGTCTNFCIGDVITLSDTITNPDGTNAADYTFAWVQTGGRTTALSNPTAANPTFILPPSGVAPGNNAVCTSGTGAVSTTSANCPTFKVTVTKTNTNKASAQSATLAAYGSTLPARPTANAGTPQTVITSQPVALAGSGAQTNGHTISYAWTQTAGAAVTLSSSTVAAPTFTAPPNADTLTFSLVVTDTQSGIVGSGTNGNTSLASTVNITVNPDQVTADAGPDQLGTHAGDTVTLTAAGSSDLSALPLSYTWQQLSGPTVTLSSTTAVSPTFTVPAVGSPTGATFTFTVTATNGGANPGDTNTDATPVTITSVPSTPSATAPTIARSGGTCADFCTGDVVTLSTTITNPDGNSPADYTYAWVQTGGRTTALSDATAANPTFTLPPSGQGSGDTDACTSGTDPVDPGSANCPTYAVTVTKTNTNASSAQSASLAPYSSTLADRPVANAGGNQDVNALEPVTLNGSGSQAQGHTITYAWTQTGGATVALSDPTAPAPTFTAPSSATVLTFSLVVTDTQSGIAGNGPSGHTSLADSVTVVVAPSSLTGTITDPDSNPVAGASVKVFSSTDTSTPSFTGTTAADGTYTIAVSPGTYDIEVVGPNGSNFFTKWYINAASRASATDVIVTDSDVSNLDVQLALGGQISGTVTMGSSDPAAGIPVYLVSPTDTFTPTAIATTAADGTYAFHALTPNSYKVEFAPAASTGLQKQYYNGVATRAAATALVVTGSEVFSTVDAHLTTPLATTPTISRSGGTCADFCTGDVVTLSTTVTNPGGHDADDYTFSWVQIGGRTTALSDATAQSPTFVLPPSGAGAGNAAACTSGTDAVDPASPSCPTYAVTVTDNTTGSASPPAALAAYSSTLPDRPVANAGGDQAVNALQPVTLHGVGTQANGHTVSYAWTQTGGTVVTLSDATAAEPTFTAPSSPTALTFSLVVTDTQSGIAGNGPNGHTSLADSVTVAVGLSSLSGTITDPDSNPVAGASVKVFSSTDTSTPSFSGTTAADGTYTIAVSPGTYDIEVVGPNGGNFFTKWYINAATRSTATDVIVTNSDVSNLDVQLALGGQISGTVTTVSTAPVSGVPVYLLAPSDTYVPTAITTTAADGTYAFHTLTPNSYKVEFAPATATGYQKQFYNGVATRAAATVLAVTGSEVFSNVDATLIGSGSISGKVTKLGGYPLAGVTVRAFAPSDTFFVSGTATTAADGTYTITGLATNNFKVYFSPPSGQGLQNQWYNGVTTRAAATAIPVSSNAVSGINQLLPGTGTISGRVTKTGGTAVAGATVYLFAPADTLFPSASTTTAANGTYAFHALPPNSYKVYFSASGFQKQYYNGVTTKAAATAVVSNSNTVQNINAVLASSASSAAHLS